MSDLNIDDFYKDAARTLVTLYRVFPRPVAIYVEDISGPDEPDEYGVHSHRHQACFATLVWLGEEGLLRYEDTIKSEAIDQAVLTGRCLAALLARVDDAESAGTETAALTSEAAELEQIPRSVREARQTNIYRLTQAIAQKSSLTLRDAIVPLLTRLTG
ncbi:MAG: hypothetical protein RIC89_00105 [Pseudomonadales bacterium]